MEKEHHSNSNDNNRDKHKRKPDELVAAIDWEPVWNQQLNEQITLLVTFGANDNCQANNICFEVADFENAYHAIIGRPVLAKFMLGEGTLGCNSLLWVERKKKKKNKIKNKKKEKPLRAASGLSDDEDEKSQ
uniref:Uncharacterized protein n=1 Tax=Oryza brachyantha TaxID=4533 RepID=J3KV64_ORYBR